MNFDDFVTDMETLSMSSPAQGPTVADRYSKSQSRGQTAKVLANELFLISNPSLITLILSRQTAALMIY